MFKVRVLQSFFSKSHSHSNRPDTDSTSTISPRKVVDKSLTHRLKQPESEANRCSRCSQLLIVCLKYWAPLAHYGIFLSKLIKSLERWDKMTADTVSGSV